MASRPAPYSPLGPLNSVGERARGCRVPPRTFRARFRRPSGDPPARWSNARWSGTVLPPPGGLRRTDRREFRGAALGRALSPTARVARAGRSGAGRHIEV